LKLRILVITQYFPPDMGAPAGRFSDFAQHWRALGHEVIVVTGMPHFPGGVIHEGYRRRLFVRETRDGADVRRCWTLTSRARFVGRALAYASFLVSACLYVAFARLSVDCVVATSPPPTVGLVGVVAARRLRVPFVLDIRDIWPEAIVQSGRLRSPLLIHAFEGIARALYRAASRITAVTHGWKQRLIEIGVPAAKIHVLPNGVDVAAFDAQSAEELPPALAALDPNARWFTYAGILNTPQGLEGILDAAARMRERSPEAYERSLFVLVGEGPREADLRAQAERLGLARVVFVPRQPRAAIYALLRRSFAVLVTLRPRKDTSTVPSKLYESLASGRPVLYSAGGEGAETLHRSGGGVVCPPGDPDALCSAMLEYLKNGDEADRQGERGRAFVAEHFDRRRLAEDFAARLVEACEAAQRGEPASGETR
jgi:glycosyltransferase involved in cell wall biosynthesis